MVVLLYEYISLTHTLFISICLFLHDFCHVIMPQRNDASLGTWRLVVLGGETVVVSAGRLCKYHSSAIQTHTYLAGINTTVKIDLALKQIVPLISLLHMGYLLSLLSYYYLLLVMIMKRVYPTKDSYMYCCCS